MLARPRSVSEMAASLVPETALVTGGNPGIGLEVRRQLAATLRSEAGDVMAVALDVTDGVSCASAAEVIAARSGSSSALVNNAGRQVRCRHLTEEQDDVRGPNNAVEGSDPLRPTGEARQPIAAGSAELEFNVVMSSSPR